MDSLKNSRTAAPATEGEPSLLFVVEDYRFVVSSTGRSREETSPEMGSCDDLVSNYQKPLVPDPSFDRPVDRSPCYHPLPFSFLSSPYSVSDTEAALMY